MIHQNLFIFLNYQKHRFQQAQLLVILLFYAEYYQILIGVLLNSCSLYCIPCRLSQENHLIMLFDQFMFFELFENQRSMLTSGYSQIGYLRLTNNQLTTLKHWFYKQGSKLTKQPSNQLDVFQKINLLKQSAYLSTSRAGMQQLSEKSRIRTNFVKCYIFKKHFYIFWIFYYFQQRQITQRLADQFLTITNK
ncbi:transmembrane protein, putative (macronuclear) [Tetrahymena thermophila SB210]|uniref:Transmembrane protein, putative n=1 Tax=Tetrahymena thermophila (strain SB210) TaxID=312017 RepID=W7WYU0_TETTS|nr:transmembrane protein, putative [Tetrahymena thermophila SB210]EWS72070.1 transmembrane protein, putative [Tetrahymena thermophila SB210]|eukprot:XP_012655381.1 transmembrane protein, putative [Tetrahymena thermophila SB210]